MILGRAQYNILSQLKVFFYFMQDFSYIVSLIILKIKIKVGFKSKTKILVSVNIGNTNIKVHDSDNVFNKAK